MSEAWDNLVDGLQSAFASVGTTLGEWIPRILVALLVLVVGRWILKTVIGWVKKLLETSPVQSVFDKAGITSALEPTDTNAAAVLTMVAYAFLMLVLWLVVFRVLEIRPIEELLERLIAVLPLIVVAAALVVIAAAIANFVADLVQPFATRREVPWLATVTRVLILLAGVLAALDLLNIHFAEDIVKIFAAALGVAFAIAFGVGGIDTAKQYWGRYLAPRND
ncbi:MAG: hypothetical protein GY926_27090 [bacterium]|nr:hypothetical protein [bacterium]MCP4968881.1 hypothetical protein [bacterium]